MVLSENPQSAAISGKRAAAARDKSAAVAVNKHERIYIWAHWQHGDELTYEAFNSHERTYELIDRHGIKVMYEPAEAEKKEQVIF